jgi:hypothetical protein
MRIHHAFRWFYFAMKMHGPSCNKKKTQTISEYFCFQLDAYSYLIPEGNGNTLIRNHLNYTLYGCR